MKYKGEPFHMIVVQSRSGIVESISQTNWLSIPCLCIDVEAFKEMSRALGWRVLYLVKVTPK
jgi:hypothetical protein